MNRIPIILIVGTIALGIGYLWTLKNWENVITFEYYVATSTAPVVEEPQYDDEWLEEADRLREQHLKYRKWQAEQAELQAEIDALRERQNELDEKILEHEKHNQAHWRDREWLARLVASYFPEEPHIAVAVARCESGLNADIQGPTNDYGLMQIHAPSWQAVAERLGLTEYRTNPVQNVQLARYIYDNAGGSFRDWVCWWSPDHLALGSR